MTFFDKIFGKRPGGIPADTPAGAAVSMIDKDLFIEERHPWEFEGQDTQEAGREPGILEALLDRDYEAMGHKDGYHLHDVGRMELQLDLLASDFRQAYDRALQDIEIQLEQLGMHMTDKTETDAPDLYMKIKARHDQLVRQRRELMLQKDLAATGEGFAERAVKYYKAGFRAGYDLYIQEELIFKHIKTI